MNKSAASKLKYAALVAAVFLLTLYFSFSKMNDGDRVRLSLEIPSSETKEIIFDAGRENIIKYLIQPNSFSIYGSLQNPSGLDDLSAEFSGFDAFLSQGSKMTDWKEIAPGQKLKTGRRGRISINAEVNFPRALLRRREIGEARLTIKSRGNPVGRVKIIIINSRY